MKTLDGSVIERGRKNLRNIKKQVVRNPAMLAQTIRRRILLTGGSVALSTTGPAGTGAATLEGGGFGAAGRAGGATGLSGLEVVVAGSSSCV